MTDAAAGLAQIRWAARSMPIMAQMIEAETRLASATITIGLPIDAKTAAFALQLSKAGAKVSFLDSSGSDNIREALAQSGITATDVATGILVGAETTMPFGQASAGTSQFIFTQEDAAVPIVEFSSSHLLACVEHAGLGQAATMALVDITNLQLAGRSVVISGYGPAGKSMASHVAALGGRVTIVESNAILATHALADGYAVQKFSDALPTCEVLVSTSPYAPIVAMAHIDIMPAGAILCDVGGGKTALPLEQLQALKDVRKTREHVVEHTLDHGNFIKLMAGGLPIHLAAGEGHPIEVSDIVLALHVQSIGQVLANGNMLAGLHSLDGGRETTVALAKLAANGATLEDQI